MNEKLLHTPEGVRDIYGDEFEKKITIEDCIRNSIRTYGYRDIQTPTFEFFDIFSSEIGTTPSKELYKFFDKEGNTLVLRPDFTPSMARCAAKYFEDDQVNIKFSYKGNTFINTDNLQGKLKEVTQMGAEFIGDDSVFADAEMLSMIIRTLQKTGLNEFQVTIGEVEYFKGLCEEAGIDYETESKLRELISEKNIFGAEELLENCKVKKENKKLLLDVIECCGSIENLTEAKKSVHNALSLKAILRLEKLYELLKTYKVEKYISFDLGMLNKYHYYTGITFRVYAYGIGDAVARGGRYDSLLSKFGKDMPAVGFMVNVDDLMSALSRQQNNVNKQPKIEVIEYNEKNYKEKIEEADEKRKTGAYIELRKVK